MSGLSLKVILPATEEDEEDDQGELIKDGEPCRHCDAKRKDTRQEAALKQKLSEYLYTEADIKAFYTAKPEKRKDTHIARKVLLPLRMAVQKATKEGVLESVHLHNWDSVSPAAEAKLQLLMDAETFVGNHLVRREDGHHYCVRMFYDKPAPQKKKKKAVKRKAKGDEDNKAKKPKEAVAK